MSSSKPGQILDKEDPEAPISLTPSTWSIWQKLCHPECSQNFSNILADDLVFDPSNMA